MSSQIEEIKSRLDIVEVISSYIKLQKAGANYKALCPFHSEKTPSFFVSPARQIWHCFGCGAGGDIFKFIMQIEGVEFGDALRILAQKAGVELKPISPEWRKLKTERQRLYEICEWTTRFFERQLVGSSKGKESKEYLFGRGMNEESIKKWRLGWAPDSWRAVSDFLVSKGYKNEEIERAGLSLRNEQGSFYDRFRARIIFPIFDLNSQVIGFSGRVLKNDEGAKYINTPNTPLYDKSRVLYGLAQAKLEIRKQNFCILVEGNTDAILSHQAGNENTVATSGTALTPWQLRVLKRYSNNLLVAFDMDIAGELAAKRGIDLAQREGFNIKVVRMGKYKDPAELIVENKKDWDRALEKAKSISDFYFETAFQQADPKTADGKRKISEILLPFLKRIPNKIEQSHWIQELARRLGGREEDIREELKRVRLEDYNLPVELDEKESSLPPKSRPELLEERLVTLILKMPENINLINDLTLFSEPIKEILVKLKENKNPDSEMFNYLSLKAEIEELEKENILPEIKFCLREIHSLKIKKKLDEISLEIKKAEEKGDLKKIEELTQKFNQIIKNDPRITPQGYMALDDL
jgi:DNA primase